MRIARRPLKGPLSRPRARLPGRFGGMFDHVTIRASDREASERFYLTVLPTLGIDLTHSGELGPEWNDFSLAQADAENPPTRRLHIGFVGALARARRRVLARRHRGGLHG